MLIASAILLGSATGVGILCALLEIKTHRAIWEVGMKLCAVALAIGGVLLALGLRGL